MTRLEDRRTLIDHIAQARAEGARLKCGLRWIVNTNSV